MPKIRKFLALFLCLILLLPLIPTVSATQTAADITDATTISGTGYNSFSFLKDKDIKEYVKSAKTASITLTNADGIGSLYLLFDMEYGAYTVRDNSSGKTFTAGTLQVLHEFLDLSGEFGAAPTSVTLEFANGAVVLSEIYAFSTGETPKFVQKWTAPLEKGADMVLFSAHGDDEQLYFAGLLPLYAGHLDLRVQVVYMVDHRTGPYATQIRKHEMLNGLWNVGVEAYPVFGPFVDFLVEDMQGTYDGYRKDYNTTEEDLLGFVVEQVRRFRPQVAVGHDLQGEYGHGMHMVYADLLTKAVSVTSDTSKFPESAAKYGAWEIPKLYLHLYPENPVVMDYDTPLSTFDGLSAFQATQKLGFACHESQLWIFSAKWLYGKNKEITKATQLKTFSPCEFGLYHSTVGEDVLKNDLMENIVPYAEQERLEQERLEQERLEQERLEQERLEQERLEQERLEQERLEQEKLEQQNQQNQQSVKKRSGLTFLLIVLGILIICEGFFVAMLLRRRKKKKSR